MRLLSLLLMLWPVLAAAQDVSPADARAVRTVIEAQLDAFKHDDAKRAFSYASPGIRESFGNAQNFLAMVRVQYPAVYRPKSVAFQSPEIVAGDLVQPVIFTDAAGDVWLALYPMQKDASGRWRINGCQLTRVKGQQT